MGIGERKTVNKAGKVSKSRTFTIYVDSGEHYASGRKKYKRVVRSLGSVHTVSKAQAKQVFEREQAKHKKNKYLASSPRLSDFAPRYIAHKRDAEGKRSWARDVYSLNHLIDYFGPDTTLAEIDSKSIDEYKVERQKTASPKTANIELGCLQNLFFLAKTWEEYAGENPVSRAGLIKKIIRDKRKPPTPEEEELIMSKLNPNIRWIFKFAANTGMRIGEILNLEVDQLHSTRYFENGEVKTIAVVELNPSDTKTGQGRVIPLNDDAKAALDEALAFNNGRHKRIFLSTKGNPYKANSEIYHPFVYACKSLGIRRITPHDLRRRFASRLVESGTSLIDAREMMGHTSYKMLETYVNTSISKIKAVQSIAEEKPQAKYKHKKKP